MEPEKNPFLPRKRKNNNFDAIKVTLASPEQVLSWSHGEVKKAETINYRTLKTEVDGLMCEKIFGPTKNYECYCGKYRKVRYKGIICDKCGVEVTHKGVRRERMGHIKLAVPVTHLWFAYSIPNKIATVLDLSQKTLLSVIYYTRYMVVEMDKEKKAEIIPLIEKELSEKNEELGKELDRKIAEIEKETEKETKKISKAVKDKEKAEFQKETISHEQSKKVAALRKEHAELEEQLEVEYDSLRKLVERIEVREILSEDEFIILKDKEYEFFKAEMGAPAVKELLSQIDMDKESRKLKNAINSTQSSAKRAKLINRLRLMEGFVKNNLKPDWMVLDVLPVLPPDLRPIIQLPGGKFATSDLNDLYRRVINRNNRLKRLIEIGAPDVILRNEKRMLQESVDSLIDNSHRPSKPFVNLRRMPYKALTDNLRGKKGRFRRNLLGKRVDYSGRAVIIGSSNLRLNQCGLPKTMALEMFKPFVIRTLIDREYALNIRMAKQMIDDGEDIVWDILEEITKDRPVLLNRAPTLHKQGIQAFYPILIEGDAIRLHPLVCGGFGADFDGDQMAVHVLLTEEAIKEAKDIMLAQENIIKSADGSIMALPAKEMLLGIFMMTEMEEKKERPVIFNTADEAISAYDIGEISLSRKVAVPVDGKTEETCVGRLIFNEALPKDYGFVNEQIGKKSISKIIKGIVRKYPRSEAVDVLDNLKDLGFRFATELGFSLAVEDFEIDIDRYEVLADGDKKEMKLQDDYLSGLSTYDEKRRLSIDMWLKVGEVLQDRIFERIDKENPVSILDRSGAASYPEQTAQIVAMKGMVRDPEGNYVDLPLKGNHIQGLNGYEYFVASSGGRKGASDTALRTAKSGYLTRKLVDVAQDVIIRIDDCEATGRGHRIKRDDTMLTRRVPFEDLIQGRWTSAEVKNSKTGKVIVKANEEITTEIATKIVEAGVQEIEVRSPMTCESPLGICKKCYGYDIGKNEPVDIGMAVGVIAAQSMGEPATQMVLQTFHSGGAGVTDITRGLPRLNELFDIRYPKMSAFIMPFDGKVEVEETEGGKHQITMEGKKELKAQYYLNIVKEVKFKEGDKVKDGDIMFTDNKEKEYQAPYAGEVSIKGNVLTVTGKMPAIEEFDVPSAYKILVETGQEVKVGTPLTEGSVDPRNLYDVVGLHEVQEYLIDNVQQVYTEQGISLDDKHVECIVRQMGRMARVVDPGDSEYLIGSYVNKYLAEYRNKLLQKDDHKPAYIEPLIMGITSASLRTESFLSAMSFQEQVRVLTEASILGSIDYLRGLKENVIIGRSIPVGEAARIDDFSVLKEIKGV
ncbi:MAG: DNA-directed RNA polymerase subunit beta' [bacterium]